MVNMSFNIGLHAGRGEEEECRPKRDGVPEIHPKPHTMLTIGPLFRNRASNVPNQS